MENDVKFVGIAPQLEVPDVKVAVEYYCNVLAFEWVDYFMDPPVFGMVHRNGVQIHFGKSESATVKTNQRKEGLDLYIFVQNIEAFYEELKERKAEIVEGLVTRFYGRREIIVRDCYGFRICFGE